MQIGIVRSFGRTLAPSETAQTIGKRIPSVAGRLQKGRRNPPTQDQGTERDKNDRPHSPIECSPFLASGERELVIFGKKLGVGDRVGGLFLFMERLGRPRCLAVNGSGGGRRESRRRGIVVVLMNEPVLCVERVIHCERTGRGKEP